MSKQVKIYVRDFATRSAVKEIDVTPIVGTSNFERFVFALYCKTNLDKFFVDTSEVDNRNTEGT